MSAAQKVSAEQQTLPQTSSDKLSSQPSVHAISLQSNEECEVVNETLFVVERSGNSPSVGSLSSIPLSCEDEGQDVASSPTEDKTPDSTSVKEEKKTKRISVRKTASKMPIIGKYFKKRSY